ncbi:MAG: 3-deoxy-7-phosphoheptulonate synthase, partial [Anaerolineae bacterium]
MIIVMRMGATQQEIENVVARVHELGFRTHLSQGEERTIIGVIGDERPVDKDSLARMQGVERIVPILRPFKLASRDFQPHDTIIEIAGHPIGGKRLTIIAGPCAVESREQILETAQLVKEAGAHMLRGGAFKPRTSPYSFQGLGEEALVYLAEARELTGLPVVTEVMSPEQVPLVAKYADILQIGTRNMQN